MGDRYEIRFSGSGGQGLILAGVIFAEAATIYDKINAVQSQSYGPEARGGASKSEVIISEEIIDFPKAQGIDLQLSLTQESCTRYYKDIKSGGILLVDEDFVRDIPEGDFKVIKLPIIRTATEQIGKSFVANIVATGAITAITGKVKIKSVEKAVLSRVPKGTEAMNKKALMAGYNMAKAKTAA
jgi:2-oxoglutarate ferredoxin oxidoreductase subunit gamma